MEKQGNSLSMGAMLLVVGGLVGAGLALLYAPQSGDKTRRQIGRYARKVRNEAEEMIRDTAETINEMVDDLGDRTAELVERGGDVAEDWRAALLDALDRGQKGLEKQRKKLGQLWEG